MLRLLIGIFTFCAAGLLYSPTFAHEPAQVTLKEWDIGFKTINPKSGQIRFEIENAGTVEHAFEVEGESGGQDIEIKSKTLKPGEKTTLEVDLPAGEYEAYCPLHDHKDKGMVGSVAVGAM